jgi:hypothetical protein
VGSHGKSRSVALTLFFFFLMYKGMSGEILEHTLILVSAMCK